MLWFLSNWFIRPEGAQSGLRCNAQNGYIIKQHNMPDCVIHKKSTSQNAGFAVHFWKSVKKRLVLSRKMHGKVLKTAEILHEKCRPCRVRAERPSASKRKADQKSVTDFSGLGIRNKMPRTVSRRKNRGFRRGELLYIFSTVPIPRRERPRRIVSAVRSQRRSRLRRTASSSALRTGHFSKKAL